MRSLAQYPAWLLGGFLDLLYPPTCPLCLERLNAFEQTVCDPCRAGLLREDTWRCARCGATGVGEAPARGKPCRMCPPPEARHRGVLAAAPYRGQAPRVIHLFKYNRRLEMGALMSDLMVARLAEPLLALDGRIGWIVPVPLHWSRLAWRGFNQSQALAERLSQAVGWPVENALRRVRRTRMQTRIPKDRREKNVAGAFAYAGPETPPGVLLVDDVVTTGHTIAECARVLALAGAPEVWVACFARA